MGGPRDSEKFCIHAGVRQGYVLSLRFFCATMGGAMKTQTDTAQQYGLDFQHGTRP